jgi:hypothetical protein
MLGAYLKGCNNFLATARDDRFPTFVEYINGIVQERHDVLDVALAFAKARGIVQSSDGCWRSSRPRPDFLSDTESDSGDDEEEPKEGDSRPGSSDDEEVPRQGYLLLTGGCARTARSKMSATTSGSTATIPQRRPGADLRAPYRQ